MSRFPKTLVLIAACFLVHANNIHGQSAGAPSFLAAKKASMTVRVHNHAGLSRKDLNFAEAVATRVFRERGVQMPWYDCGPSIHADNDPGCRESLNSNTFDLRICRNCPPSLMALGREVGGYANGQMATVCSRWTEELEQTRYVSSTEVLGRVIVHELGHLVLGPGHSPVGVMKADWTAGDVDAAKLGSLTFTTEQGELIRSKLNFHGSASSETAASAKSSIQGNLPSANK